MYIIDKLFDIKYSIIYNYKHKEGVMKKKRKQSRKRKWSRIEILMLLTFLSTVVYQILDLVLR